jgi:transposase
MSTEAREYTTEYKVQAVKMAQKIGNIKQSAKELGIPAGTLGTWIQLAKHGKIDLGMGSQTPERGLTMAAEMQELRAKIKALEKENARIAEINEFLDKATRFFASSQQK